MKLKFMLSLAALASAIAPTIAVALSGGAPHGKAPNPRVRVTPATGSPTTRFEVSFRLPERTGRVGGMNRYVDVALRGSGSRSGCVNFLDAHAPAGNAGARVRVMLAPAGGHWCTGSHHGEIDELESPVCPSGRLCPAFLVLRRVIGRFVVHVRATGDSAPPRFAGIKSAMACTPGPQGPGQTTSFNLAWDAATDDIAPRSQIIYDIYVSTTAGGEDFSKPTWTTPPGVTRYRTPGLPSHGTFYFVTRARDSAGNEDRNTVERHGVDPCY